LRQRAARLMLKAYVVEVDRGLKNCDWAAAIEKVEEISAQLPLLSTNLDPLAFRRLLKCADLAEVCARRTPDKFLAKRAIDCASQLRALVPNGETNQRYGTVDRVREDLKFGFISIPGRESELFFHYAVVRPRSAFFTMQAGDEVLFREGVDVKGRPHAAEVTVLIDE
jgi:cold shock CspA family protein